MARWNLIIFLKQLKVSKPDKDLTYSKSAIPYMETHFFVSLNGTIVLAG